MVWGFHLALDIARCSPKTIRCPTHLSNFTKTLVKRIDMKAFGEPQIQHFGEADKLGYTGIQLIETSCISFHCCEETNDMYLDVFSCKPYNTADVVATVREHFQPEDMKATYFERKAPSKKPKYHIEWESQMK